MSEPPELPVHLARDLNSLRHDGCRLVVTIDGKDWRLEPVMAKNILRSWLNVLMR